MKLKESESDVKFEIKSERNIDFIEHDDLSRLIKREKYPIVE